MGMKQLANVFIDDIPPQTVQSWYELQAALIVAKDINTEIFPSYSHYFVQPLSMYGKPGHNDVL